jgi:DNA-binding beta-propeller fold protein YncE
LRAFIPALLLALLASSARAAPPYRLTATVQLGSPERRDYVVADPTSRRVYVAHGDRVAIVDGMRATLVGNVAGIPGGTHGTATSLANGLGFTDDGEAGQVVVFDLTTLAVIKRLPAAQDADAIVADPLTGHVFVIEGDPHSITVVDPARLAVLGTIAGGEQMEYAVADGTGHVFVAGKERGDLIDIDARTDTLVAHRPMPGCTKPHGLAVDPATRRIFMGCSNAMMMVIDATDGRMIARLPIGRGSDAVAFDPVRKRVFSSNGIDGTVSIYQQIDRDHYRALPVLETEVSGRTMGVDPSSGRLFVAVARSDPARPPGSGTAALLVFDPVE